MREEGKKGGRSLLSVSWVAEGLHWSLAGKDSACNARDPGLIHGLGRSPGEGRSYSLQYLGAPLVAQLVKNLLALQETWV